MSEDRTVSHSDFSNPLFDAAPPRSGTSASKWEKYAGTDILPFWVADMEFATAPSIVAAARARIEHPIFGYTEPPESLTAAALGWLRRTYDWSVDSAAIVWLPGVVAGFNMACRATCEPGDAVLVPIPVYHPFLEAPRHCGAEATYVPLARADDQWVMDFDRLEAACTRDTRLLLFCNPQNPTGRVYGKSELSELIAFCQARDITLCSDEIHCGLILDPTLQHVPIASMDHDFAQQTISLFAPSKSFNIPGLSCAFAVIPDADLRTRFDSANLGMLSTISPVSYAAAEAAFNEQSDWLPDLLRYLQHNAATVRTTAHSLGLPMTPVEGTYLAWIDVRALNLAKPGAWFEQHGIGMSDGAQFGCPGFVRLNFACSQEMLQAGLSRLAQGVAAAHKQ